jgi:hypothetical protein
MAIWFLAAGVAIPITSMARHHNTTSPTPRSSLTWRDELSYYLDYVPLSPRIDKQLTVISFRLDERHRIQDVQVVAKDVSLIRSIKLCLQGARILNDCPVITDELGNSRCVVRVLFDMND